jgi:hypothetical protein
VKIPGRENPQANTFQLVHNWLLSGSKSKWLVVLDNVDDARFLIDTPSTGETMQTDTTGSENSRPLEAYLPYCNHGSVLVTSRAKSAALKLVNEHAIVAVEPMGKPDALALFKKKLGSHSDGNSDSDDDIADLIEALEYMPLAIVQAAAYISRRAPRSSIRQYLEDFRESDRRKTILLEYESETLRRDRRANNSIIATWQITFDHIREIRPSAADLLSLMCFFDRQGIPQDLLRSRAEQRDSLEKQKQSRKIRAVGLSIRNLFNRKGGSRAILRDQDRDIKSSHDRLESSDHCPNTRSSRYNGDGDDGFEEDIVVLRDYSFISANSDQKTFEMHRLVQLATRKWLEAQKQEEKWRERFIKNLGSALPKSGKYEDWPRWQLLFPHAQSAAAQRPLHRDALLDWSLVLYRAAFYAYEMGNGREAETLATQTLEIRETFLGRRDNETLSSMTLLSALYRNAGKWDIGADLALHVLETRKQIYGVDDSRSLNAMYSLADMYIVQGKLDAAEQLLVQAKKITTKKYGPDDPFIVDILGCLARIYRRRGWFEIAEQFSVQVLNNYKKQLGTDHPKTLRVMGRLGSTYLYQKRFAAAEELISQTWATSKKILGADNFNTLVDMHELACIWMKMDRLPEAIALMEECIQSRKRVLGPEHPHTLLSCSVLAEWKAEQEELANEEQSEQEQWSGEEQSEQEANDDETEQQVEDISKLENQRSRH